MPSAQRGTNAQGAGCAPGSWLAGQVTPAQFCLRQSAFAFMKWTLIGAAVTVMSQQGSSPGATAKTPQSPSLRQDRAGGGEVALHRAARSVTGSGAPSGPGWPEAPSVHATSAASSHRAAIERMADHTAAVTGPAARSDVTMIRWAGTATSWSTPDRR